MIAHSPTAWDHVHFKDVLVKVSNVEVYYKAISFYLAEHPDLLVDMLKVGTCTILYPPACCAQSSPHMLHVASWSVEHMLSRSKLQRRRAQTKHSHADMLEHSFSCATWSRSR